MLLQEFPNIQWLRKRIQSRFDHNAGWPTVLLNAKSQQEYRDNIEGPLSLFFNLSGESVVGLEGHSTLIPEDCFFLSNAGQSYTLAIDVPRPVETFNIHLGDRFVAEAYQSFYQKAEAQIEDPSPDHPPLNFYPKLYHKDQRFRELIAQIRREAPAPGLREIQESNGLYDLVAYLFSNQLALKTKIEQLPAIKGTTRVELKKRLFRAVDYIYAHYRETIQLDDLAAVACLSRFYFLRLFKAVFGLAPHQFIAQLRLQEAENLLKTQRSVEEIAFTIGYENGSSFSRWFYRKKGLYPSQFRAKWQ